MPRDTWGRVSVRARVWARGRGRIRVRVRARVGGVHAQRHLE